MKTLITLIKISDVEDPKHPNHIPAGYVTRGWLMDEPEVGKRFQVNSFWSTSPVTAILDNDRFTTLNSLYQLERKLVADDVSIFNWVQSGKEVSNE